MTTPINIKSTDILDLFKLDKPDHVEALMQMRDTFSSAINAEQLADSDLARFLIARKFDVEEATKMLSAHLEWRVGNPLVRKKECMVALGHKNTYCYGHDLHGHPLLVFHSVLHNPKTRDLDETNRMFQFWMQHALAALPDDKSKITVIIDRTGAGMSNQDTEFLKSLNALWQDNFPERIYRIIVCPTGMIFYGLWNIVQYFLDPVTKDKVKPCYSPSEVTKYVDPQFLPLSLSGTSTFTVPDYEDLPESAPHVEE